MSGMGAIGRAALARGGGSQGPGRGARRAGPGSGAAWLARCFGRSLVRARFRAQVGTRLELGEEDERDDVVEHRRADNQLRAGARRAGQSPVLGPTPPVIPR